MKLTRLRLLGFKSFVDATDILIEPGLTGIVGPNGCGKSNLVEALRFVMGESSWKAMRGDAMEDVIFSGTSGRPARNFAEVAVFADNASRTAPIAFNDSDALEISRRIERDAGSSYRINGREVRARDVALLFADAATGARSSALVRQGQIAEIIAARPAERRGILEDAAGIAGLHSRRHEAELRLKAAELNLERLADVMSEISGRLDGLRRQARQAARYRNLSAEIHRAEAALLALRWQAAGARLHEAEAALTQAAAALAEAAEAQARAARDEAVAGASLPKRREARASAEAALARMRALAAEIEREAARHAARRKELAARSGEAARDLEREREIRAEAEAALARLDEEERSLLAGRAEAQAQAEAARAAARDGAVAGAELEARLDDATRRLAGVAAERAQAERALSDARGRAARLANERAGLERERAALAASDPSGAAEASAAALAQAEATLAEAEAAAQSAAARLAETQAAEREAAGPRAEADKRLVAVESEAKTLSRVLGGDRADGFPPVIDAIEVAPGFEAALAAALGDDLDASLDEAAPRVWRAPADADDPALPEGAEPLGAHVRAPAPLSRRLRQVGVVAGEAGGRLAAGLRPGQRLVTREGALWRWDGLAVRAGALSPAARRLEQRNRLAALDAEVAAARDERERAAGAARNAADARAEAERDERASRLALKGAREALDAARRTDAQAAARAAKQAERLAALQAAVARAEAGDREAAAAVEAAAAALAGLADTGKDEAEREALRRRLDAARAGGAEARARAELLGAEAAARASRLERLAAERQAWQAGAARAAARLAELDGRLRELAAERERLDAEPQSFETRRRTLLSETAAAEAAARAAADALAGADAEHRRAAAEARAALERLSAARERRGRAEERVEAARAGRDEVAARVRDAFDRPPQDLRGLAGFDPGAPLPDAAAIEARLDRLRRERERLGGVNLRADDEVREIEERLDAFARERADLEGAIGTLRSAVGSLNREGRERLLKAFGQVNEHFGSLFRHLFGGGAAELVLAGSDDPLEAGLEIVARPPGKRPQTMSLLSGGEQALTAMSLIFAVFLTNPSPICVLDEVDAPLDDANVERFCALLDDMRRRTETRFLIITHNPITMARMDRLYGVTMAERGVSQVVSVDLEEGERYREAG